MRILLFGGTFDPPHLAHVDLAARAARGAGCDRILYIPSAQNPLKLGPPDTAPEHRLAMLALATSNQPQAQISTIELDRGGVSYFIDTLDTIRRRFGDDAELCFLVGADQALHFPRWKDWQRILEMATPVLIIRPPWARDTLVDALVDVYGDEGSRRWIDAIVDTPLSGISSSAVRRGLEEGDATSDGLDPAVATYIAERGLYRG